MHTQTHRCVVHAYALIESHRVIIALLTVPFIELIVVNSLQHQMARSFCYLLELRCSDVADTALKIQHLVLQEIGRVRVKVKGSPGYSEPNKLSTRLRVNS